MNPISNASLFLGLTDDLDSASRRAVAFRAVVLAFIIVALFTVLGRQIFEMFGITLPAFRIAGGILVGLVGYQLMHGQESSVQTPTAEDNSRSREAALGIAISPLALPIDKRHVVRRQAELSFVPSVVSWPCNFVRCRRRVPQI